MKPKWQGLVEGIAGYKHFVTWFSSPEKFNLIMHKGFTFFIVNLLKFNVLQYISNCIHLANLRLNSMEESGVVSMPFYSSCLPLL